MTAQELVGRIVSVIINPIIILLFTLALLIFIIGVIRFVSASEDAEKRAEAKRSVAYGLLGMFIMVAVFGIIAFIRGTLGLLV